MVLSLSQRLGVLPEELNKLLIGVVVLSMALTPALSSLGDLASDKLMALALSERRGKAADLELRRPALGEGKGIGGDERVVICGFGPVGQIVGRYIDYTGTCLYKCIYLFLPFFVTAVRTVVSPLPFPLFSPPPPPTPHKGNDRIT